MFLVSWVHDLQVHKYRAPADLPNFETGSCTLQTFSKVLHNKTYECHFKQEFYWSFYWSVGAVTKWFYSWALLFPSLRGNEKLFEIARVWDLLIVNDWRWIQERWFWVWNNKVQISRVPLYLEINQWIFSGRKAVYWQSENLCPRI